MPAFIMGVDGTSATLRTKSITLNGTYNASSDDADGYSTVTVNVQPPLQIKSITPTTSEQYITADEGYYGLQQVTIASIPPEYIIPTGTIPITSNGTVDVKNYEYANVNVGGGGGELFQKLVDKSITSVSSSDFGNITSIGDYAFYGCTSLTSITISEGVTSIGEYAFAGTSSLPMGLTSFTFSANSQLKTIGNQAFRWCSNLTSIVIPDSIKTIGNYAFNFCSSIQTITLGHDLVTTSDSTAIGGYIFSNCSSLTTVNYNGTTTEWNNITKNQYWKSGKPDNLTLIHCTNGNVAI